MTTSLATKDASTGGRRIFLVEDEFLIRMLLEDMLADLGHELAGVAGRVDEAVELARTIECDIAILDVNLEGQEVFPVADILAARDRPFIFATGYGGGGLPPQYKDRPTLQKPFQFEDLSKALAQIIVGGPNAGAGEQAPI